MASVLGWEFIDAGLPKGALGLEVCVLDSCQGHVKARGLCHSIEGAA